MVKTWSRWIHNLRAVCWKSFGNFPRKKLGKRRVFFWLVWPWAVCYSQTFDINCFSVDSWRICPLVFNWDTVFWGCFSNDSSQELRVPFFSIAKNGGNSPCFCLDELCMANHHGISMSIQTSISISTVCIMCYIILCNNNVYFVRCIILLVYFIHLFPCCFMVFINHHLKSLRSHQLRAFPPLKRSAQDPALA